MKVNMARELMTWDDIPIMEQIVKRDRNHKIIYKTDKDGNVTDMPEIDERPFTLGLVCLHALSFVEMDNNGKPKKVLTSKEQQDRYYLGVQINGAMKKNKGIADLSQKDDIPVLLELISVRYAEQVNIAGQAVSMIEEEIAKTRKTASEKNKVTKEEIAEDEQ